MKSLALATMLALTALVHPVAAKDVWTQINETAPRSVCDGDEAAPRIAKAEDNCLVAK